MGRRGGIVEVARAFQNPPVNNGRQVSQFRTQRLSRNCLPEAPTPSFQNILGFSNGPFLGFYEGGSGRMAVHPG